MLKPIFIKHKAKVILPSLLASACFAHAADLASFEKVSVKKDNELSIQSVIPGEQNDTIALGTAYHSLKEGFYGLQSVQGQFDESYGNTEADIRIGIDMGYAETKDLIDGEIGLGVSLKKIDVSAGASYAKENAADEFTGSYTFHAAIKPKKRLLLPNDNTGYQPTQAAQELADAYPGDRYNQLGDEFVVGYEYGAYLNVTMTIEYRNAQEKQDIGGYLSVGFAGKVDVKGSLNLVDEDAKKSAKIRIRAQQSGGDPVQLSQIISEGLAECTLDNPSPCFTLFESVVQYMKGTDVSKKEFLTQFDSLDDYNIRRIFTQRYDESGPGLNDLTPDTGYEKENFLSKLAFKQINDAYVDTVLDQRRAENMLSYYSASLSSTQKAAVEAIVQDAKYNSFIYDDAVRFCKRNPLGTACRDRKVSADALLRSYDKSNLELNL